MKYKLFSIKFCVAFCGFILAFLSSKAQTTSIFNVAVSPTTICAGEFVTVTFDTVGTATSTFSVILSNPDGTYPTLPNPPNIIGAPSVSTTIVVQIPAATPASSTYTINVGALVGAGFVLGDTSQVLTINQPLADFTASITASITEICPNSSVTFTATMSSALSGASYEWFIDNVSQGVQASPTFTTTSIAADAVVNCEVTLTGECIVDSTATSNDVNITIGNNIPFTATASANPASACEGQSVALTANVTNGVGPYTYTWNYILAGDTTSIANGISITSSTIPAGATTFVTISSAATCLVNDSVSANTSLVVLSSSGSAPQITIYQAESFCTDTSGVGTGTFTVAPVISNATYIWFVDGVQINTTSKTELTLNTGNVVEGQVVVCKITLNAPCSAVSTSSSNGIAITKKEAAVVNITTDFCIIYGENAKLEILTNNINPGTISWTPSSKYVINSATSSLPSVYPKKNTTFVLSALDNNNCRVSAKVEVCVLPNKNIFLPDAFSPNDDDVNDVFYCRSLVEQFEHGTFLMQVFDEFGTKVFESKFQSYGWDGNYRNQPCDQGCYLYHVSGAYFNKEPFEFKGKILLLR